MSRHKVAILGASGMLGQKYQLLLQNHPWFEIGAKLGSDKPSLTSTELKNIDLLFSCVPNEIAQQAEPAFAQHGITVISNAAAYRHAPDVPLIIPEVNEAHLATLSKPGCIITKPNCAVQSYLIALAPLHRAFGITKIFVTTLQAKSGGGRSCMEDANLDDNLYAHIAGEEEKNLIEPLKILGSVQNRRIVPNHAMTLSVQCNRVPITDGHLACVSVAFEKKPTQKEIRQAWEAFNPLDLPSSPKKLIHYKEILDVKRDRVIDKGMAVTISRLRPCPILDFKFVSLIHNTIRGGAGGGILTAELLVKKGML